MNRTRRAKIHTQLRKTVTGTALRPRLSVYRSLSQLHAQLIDDTTGKTIAAVSSLKMTGSLTSKATEIGKAIAGLAKEKKIASVVFDRGGFAYAGSVKTLCEAARSAGLNI